MSPGVVRAAIYKPESDDYCESWSILTDYGSGEVWRHPGGQWHGDRINVGLDDLEDAIHATAAAIRQKHDGRQGEREVKS